MPAGERASSLVYSNFPSIPGPGERIYSQVPNLRHSLIFVQTILVTNPSSSVIVHAGDPERQTIGHY